MSSTTTGMCQVWDILRSQVPLKSVEWGSVGSPGDTHCGSRASFWRDTALYWWVSSTHPNSFILTSGIDAGHPSMSKALLHFSCLRAKSWTSDGGNVDTSWSYWTTTWRIAFSSNHSQQRETCFAHLFCFWDKVSFRMKKLLFIMKLKKSWEKQREDFSHLLLLKWEKEKEKGREIKKKESPQPHLTWC